MTEIQIIIDPIGHNRVGGWARNTGKPYVHVTLGLSIDDSFIGLVTASKFRPDLVAARIGTGHYGWSLEIPRRFMDGRTHRVHAKDLASGKEVISDLQFPKPQVLFAIDHVTGRGVQGWVADPTINAPLVVFLESRGEDIARSIANEFREDLLKNGIGSGKHAFRLAVPFEITLRGLDDVKFGYYESPEKKVYLDILDLPRGLIHGAMIACHVPQGDASKYYRAELQARHLWQSGCEVALESQERASSIEFSGKDFVIFQRSPVDEDIKKSVSAARKLGTAIFYETDDLNMFMELRQEFGSVKSGFMDKNATDLINWVQRRFSAANFADAIIVPNSYMKRWLNSHGYNSIVSEFFMEDRNILSRRKSKIGNSWRILYMSGSRTHEDDFRQAELDLRYFLENNEDVTLTILGDVEVDRFRTWPRTSVIEKQKYQDMLHIIDDHDILLAPFSKSVFNFAKSPTKFMEAAARGVPVIASALPNYISHIRRTGVGYFVPWRKDWYDALVTAKKNRIEDHRRSPDLCSYVKKNMAISSRGIGLFWKISDEYERCVALPSRLRNEASLHQPERTAAAR